MENHNLEINFSKTKLITFHPHQKAPIKLNYSYNNTKLEQVNEFTLLGITIDTHVNWKNRLNLPTSNLKIHSSGPLIMSIKIYNNLPRMLKDETKTSVFLNKLITFLHSKCYYSIKEFMDDKSIKK
ncbi:hypothetical protein SFRURICE_001110 [Spodoptera frugiperda]|nr:hypothetical protein SFRURICE_001110 [Spodoptera frugiperda]